MFSGAELRQLVLVLWIVLCICLCAVFGWCVLMQIRRGGWRRRDLPDQAAIGLFVYFLGEVIVRVTYFRLSILKPVPSLAEWPILLFGDLLAVIGGLCAIRVFAPFNGRALMIGAAVVSVGIMVGVHIWRG